MSSFTTRRIGASPPPAASRPRSSSARSPPRRRPSPRAAMASAPPAPARSPAPRRSRPSTTTAASRSSSRSTRTATTGSGPCASTTTASASSPALAAPSPRAVRSRSRAGSRTAPAPTRSSPAPSTPRPARSAAPRSTSAPSTPRCRAGAVRPGPPTVSCVPAGTRATVPVDEADRGYGESDGVDQPDAVGLRPRVRARAARNGCNGAPGSVRVHDIGDTYGHRWVGTYVDTAALVESPRGRPQCRLRSIVRHRRRSRVPPSPGPSPAGPAGTGRKPRRPGTALPAAAHQPHAVSDGLRDRIVGIADGLAARSLDAGPATIASGLATDVSLISRLKTVARPEGAGAGTTTLEPT